MLIISHKKIHWQMGSIMCVTRGMSVCPSHTVWVSPLFSGESSPFVQWRK